jgi:hypothetical protein
VVATATAAIVVLTPASFDHFQRPKFYFQPISFTFETFGKKIAETKIVARVNVKKIEAKKKAFKSPAMKRQRFFYQNWSKMAKVCGFLAAAEALLKCYE